MLDQSNILFNPLKHHAGFVREFLSETDLQSLLSQVKIIGNCQMDFYYGPLSMNSIYDQTLQHLNSAGIYSCNDYENFLHCHGGYLTIELTDHSKWILRMGHKGDQFVHLHPARKSPYSFRIVANALKTALLQVFLVNREQMLPNGLKDINEMRSRFLDLAPVKKPGDLKGVDRIRKILFDPFVDWEKNEKHHTCSDNYYI
ncbi:MAG TPA: hypothetical protein VFW11_11210 [Cyclobacteriaceae bacterium]|nr:hypothetical protein [Cyclobacteriaceae bacterium]